MFFPRVPGDGARDRVDLMRPLLKRVIQPRSSAASLSTLTTYADATTAALWVAVAAYGSQIVASQYLSRGWLNPDVALRIGQSSVPGAGRGVYAASDIPMATALGHYPGRLLSQVAYEQKRMATPAAASYCWVLDEQCGVLDPTDAQGVLREPLPRLDGVPLLEPLLGTIDTTLALINEPSAGMGLDVNVATEQRKDTLIFSTARDVATGEELFLDYGPLYDRSAYGR